MNAMYRIGIAALSLQHAGIKRSQLPLRVFIADGDDFLGAAEFEEADVAERRLDDEVRLVDMQARLGDARFHDVDGSE